MKNNENRGLNAFLDNSYLHSIDRCIRQEANGENDMLNFIRFIGEIISHRRLYISVKKTGPVFPKTQRIISQINKIYGEDILGYINQEDIDYDQLCYIVALHISQNFSKFMNIVVNSNDQNPDFSNDQNPDTQLHEIFVGNGKQIKSITTKKIKEGGPSIVIKTLLNKNLLVKIRDYIENYHNEWTPSDSLSLSSKIRTEAYFELSKGYNYSYLPSIGRLKSKLLNETSSPLKNLIIDSNSPYNENLLNNSLLLKSLFAINDYNPEKIINAALKLRYDTKKIKNRILGTKKGIGDASILFQYKEINIYKKIIDGFLDNSLSDSFFSALSPSIAYSPLKEEFTLSPNFGKLLTWITNKRRFRMVKPYLIPIATFSSKYTDIKFDDMELFKYNCGL